LKTDATDFLEGIELFKGLQVNPNMKDYRDILEQIRAKERHQETKNSRLRKAKSFKFCVEMMESTAAKPPEKAEKSHHTIFQEIMNHSGLEEFKPIILVPSAAMPGNLCLRNAKQFLVDGRYQLVEGVKTTDVNTEEFKYPINDLNITFEICDDIASLKNSHKM
jgi:hypothetical protein